APARRRIDIPPSVAWPPCCVAGSLARRAVDCNLSRGERREGGPRRSPRHHGTFFSVCVPGRISAPGPGSPAVALMVLAVVAPSQNVVTRTPWLLVFG